MNKCLLEYYLEQLGKLSPQQAVAFRRWEEEYYERSKK